MILTPYITTRREAGRGTKGNFRLGRRADSGSVGQGSWVKGHGSNGSTNLDGSRGSWVSACHPL